MKTLTTTVRASLGGLVAAGILVAAPVTAQDTSVDARWYPFLGCWESTGEGADDSMLCIQPVAGERAVEVVTVAGGEVKSRELLAADGQARDRSREGCEGVETARFSDDSRRVYLQSAYSCEGGVERASTGLMAMVSPVHWVDIQTVEVGGREVAWVQRYRLASIDRAAEVGMADIGAGIEMAVQSARLAAAVPANVDDVIEASGHLSGEAVQAWISEQNDGFDIGAAELVRMADAGVPAEVIDVVVAVSYPEHFQVDNGAERMAEHPEATSPWFGRRGWYGRGYDPYYSGYYSPYGYGYGYNSYGYYGGYRPTVVIVQPKEEGAAGGRMVKGRGYTRGSGGSSSGGSTPSVRPSSGSTGGTAAPSTGSKPAPAPRKAKPKGGGI